MAPCGFSPPREVIPLISATRATTRYVLPAIWIRSTFSLPINRGHHHGRGPPHLKKTSMTASASASASSWTSTDPQQPRLHRSWPSSPIPIDCLPLWTKLHTRRAPMLAQLIAPLRSGPLRHAPSCHVAPRKPYEEVFAWYQPLSCSCWTSSCQYSIFSPFRNTCANLRPQLLHPTATAKQTEPHPVHPRYLKIPLVPLPYSGVAENLAVP